MKIRGLESNPGSNTPELCDARNLPTFIPIPSTAQGEDTALPRRVTVSIKSTDHVKHLRPRLARGEHTAMLVTITFMFVMCLA